MTPTPHIRRPGMEEATPMYLILLGAACALTLTGAAWWRIRQLQRAIRIERAAVRLTRAADHRDMDAFRNRIEDLVAEHRATAEADQVLAAAAAIVTAELARTTRTNPHEGDPT